MEACFDDLITGQGEGAGWRQNRPAAPKATESVTAGALLTEPEVTLSLKKATLWGGNLSVLVALLGTPYFPVIKSGILFLEDVGEHPYRIERMLTQLLHAGVLAQQKAIVLGQFTEFKLVPHDRGFKLQTVVNWLRQQIKAPVLTNLPYGHVATKVVLPVGAKTELMAEGRDAMLFWGHL
jgi:muramoyltetrapeptide carboxypeptidase